eukprot:CAMPEP_0113848182 /NCGR_PEP_ID=MMETSP0372-20130328/2329_1 /TAXON_ID=340204 /ORGANISM="Lankesteria abbotti" /LENGTH=240 /DNA_ID=CAMNT_0000817625 /DNA_START=46 /DNA_END=768 /DNA_ORIENTATION=+ /assembly_acc=CAM_ASM_000359
MEGVKQGTCVVGCRSSSHVVLCALKRNISKLAAANKKLMKIDDHIGVTWAGITADAKVLANFMRMECLNHKYIYDAQLSVGRLVNEVADKSQIKTQRASKRPFCIGTLVAGYDTLGPHLFETCPSGQFNEYYAMAIGRRCQSAKTYLEKHFEEFNTATLPELIVFALNALNASLSADLELTSDNVALGVVGIETPWHELPHVDIESYLEKVEKIVRRDVEEDQPPTEPRETDQTSDVAMT